MNAEERARKNEVAILRALASTGQSRIAEQMGISESHVSRMKSEGKLAEIGKLLAHLELKVVPEIMQCFDAAYVEHLRALAQLGLRYPIQDQVLEWEE